MIERDDDGAAPISRRSVPRRPLLSVVAPVHDEAGLIDVFHERLSQTLTALQEVEHEIVLVDDGSRDGSYAILKEIVARDSKVRVVKLSRNFGHQLAITAGIQHALGDAVVVMDADLQDPPEVIPALVAKWLAGDDVVHGVREAREGESWLKLTTARIFYRLMRRVSATEIPIDVGDFRLISRRVVDRFLEIEESDRFVRGLISWLGYRQSGVSYRRDARYAGETKFSLSKMLNFALDGLTSFSSVPLRLVSWLGCLTSALAFLYGLSVFVQKAMGYTVQGWATIMVGLLFLGGVQLICLGILGEYIGRIFNEVKRRPLFIVEETLGGADPPPAISEGVSRSVG